MTRESDPYTGHASRMSSATPAAFLSAMSMTTTSASCFSATPRATVAPTFPAPPTTVTLRFILSLLSRRSTRNPRNPQKTSGSACSACSALYVALHVLDNGVGELRRLQFRRAVHLAGEVVGDALGGDRAVHALHDQIRRLAPAEVTEHHLAGEDHRAGVHLVLVGVLRRRAVRRFEDGVTGDVVDVAARRDADAADLRRERVGQVVAVEVQRRDDVELVGPRQHLLQRDVGDGVLDHDAGARLPRRNPAPRPAVDLHGAEELLGDLVAPVAEGALRVLHDVALVHERHALAAVLHRVFDRAVHEALGPEPADRLQPEADVDPELAVGRADRLELRLPGPDRRLRAESDFSIFFGEFLLEELEHLLRLRRAGHELDAGVDVLGVLAEDHHVDLLGVLHRRRHAFVPAHGAEADVQIEHLAQRDVQRPDAAADRGRQRSFDADEILAEGLDGVVWQPAAELLEAFLTGVDLHPRDLLFAGVGLLDGGVEYADARAPDVRSGAVAFDKRNDRVVRDDKLPVFSGNRGAGCWRFDRSEVRHMF